ncbi:NADP-dependent oxidoreductase [[Kitasatospora] papulosa]|uniref:NADP-dependent oxidoreductase n=1 Tax=Streptomyces TaxID=1883 RepID=UPI0004BE3B96|nr:MULTISPECIES: NADP-dependent oxidoreductase [Streptomyces]MDX3186598.1 NADP-dependent oxidoreductase [Streptomyces sp. ME02-7008A-1]MDX3307380.1 NADP-dependent oxidoreductase [Streptomyces sp. ME02-7008A]WSZ45851.1 NADP-dependent oxidoreductase [[Kitasatospora] papulosa]
MKAAVIGRTGPADELTYADVELPQTGPHDIRVKTAFAAVNPVDIWTRRGIPGVDLTFPAVLGWDVAGTVDAVGSEVTRFRVGDRVMGMVKQMTRLQGTYAEFVSAPHQLFAPLPAGLSLETAAAAPLTVLTSAQLLSNLHLPDRAKVLVTGAAGAVGRVTVQRLIQAGHEVSGLARATDHDDLASLGVRTVYPSGADIPSQAFDAVIDTAGVPQTISNVRDGGEFLSITDNEQPEPERAITPRKNYVEEDGPQLAAIAEQLADGTLTVPVCRTYPLSDAAAAHAAFEQGGLRGKLLLAL